MTSLNKNIALYFNRPVAADRWVKGDRYLRSMVKTLLGKKQRLSSIEKVHNNLQLGLSRLGQPFREINSFDELEENDVLITFGTGISTLEGYRKLNPVITGIGLMTHPSECPDLLEKYPVKKYLQHSKWANDLYIPYYGNACAVWPAGIDTAAYQPASGEKSIDVLVYNKIMWNRELTEAKILEPVKDMLNRFSLRYEELKYGNYEQEDYKSLLANSKAMIFLCEHESQGIACQEAMSMDVPVFAWDQGIFLDPVYTASGETFPASSVPYFDSDCGARFTSVENLEADFDLFWQQVKAKKYNPRKYVVDNLSVEKSAAIMLRILEEI